MSDDTARRARTAADPDLIAEVEALIDPLLRRVLYNHATDLGYTGGERSAWVASACVLLESGLLTDRIARNAAIGAEVRWAQEEGISPQAAHVRLAEPLGMTRQGIESRLSLVGRRPGRRGTVPAEDLRRHTTEVLARESLAESPAVHRRLSEDGNAPHRA